QAVAEGVAEITCSSVPDLFVDGLACCDQATAGRLAQAGLIAPAYPGRPDERVPAVLTEAGKRALQNTPDLVSRWQKVPFNAPRPRPSLPPRSRARAPRLEIARVRPRFLRNHRAERNAAVKGPTRNARL